MKRKELNIHHKLDTSRYKSWIDSYFQFYPKTNYILVAIFTGILTFLSGVVWSIAFGFFDLFISTYQTYLVNLGIIWVMCWIRWATIYFFNYLNELIDHWGMPKREDFLKLDRALKLCTRNSLLITNSVLLTLLIWFVVHFHLARVPILLRFNFISFLLPSAWYENPHVVTKGILIFWSTLLASFLIATTGTQIVLFSFKIVKVVGNIFNFGIPSIAVQELKPLGVISLGGSFSWFIGIGIILIACIRGPNIIIWLLICLFILGFDSHRLTTSPN